MVRAAGPAGNSCRRRYSSSSNSASYSPSPWAANSSLGTKRSAAEFMQKRCPVGLGPSGKTWPRCESLAVLRTSVRVLKSLWSSRVVTASSRRGLVKLGQPLPESYFPDC